MWETDCNFDWEVTREVFYSFVRALSNVTILIWVGIEICAEAILSRARVW